MAKKKAAKKTTRATNRRKKPDLSYIAEGLRPLAEELTQLNPDPSNANTHDERNLTAIKSSLARYSQRTPIVVNRNGSVILKGNGTFEAAKELGWTHLAVVWVEDDQTTATGYAIADNRTSDLSEFDAEILTAQLQALKADDVELEDLGFSDAELNELIDAALPADDSPAAAADESGGASSSDAGDDSHDETDQLATGFKVLIECSDEQQQTELLERFSDEGLECRALTV